MISLLDMPRASFQRPNRVRSLLCRLLVLAPAFGVPPCSLPVLAHAVQDTAMELDGIPLAVTRDELAALTDLANRLEAPPGPQDRALAIARGKAQGRDARYVLALYELEIGRQRKDDALRAQALDELIASGRAPAGRLARYLEMRGRHCLSATRFRPGWDALVAPGAAHAGGSERPGQSRASPAGSGRCRGRRRAAPALGRRAGGFPSEADRSLVPPMAKHGL